jgi:hypothetical protein
VNPVFTVGKRRYRSKKKRFAFVSVQQMLWTTAAIGGALSLFDYMFARLNETRTDKCRQVAALTHGVTFIEKHK